MKRKVLIKKILCGVLAGSLYFATVPEAAHAVELQDVKTEETEISETDNISMTEAEAASETVEMEVSVPAAETEAASGTVEMEVSVPAAETETVPETEKMEEELTARAVSGEPVLRTTLSGTEWNGVDDARIYVAPSGEIALDQTELVISEGSDKYEIVNGYLKPKDGVVVATGDTITVSTNAKYYTEDQLLWHNGFEDNENRLTESVAGKYGLMHSDVMAHNGLKAGTPDSRNNKDGLWSPEIGSEGRLVFWYYDPATPAELDPAELAAYKDGQGKTFDQMKFGVAVNGYSDLLLGVAIPSESESGGTDHFTFASTYTVRNRGTWTRTNIVRTTGWHKMEAEVGMNGASLYIDGNQVCLNETGEPIVADIKTIDKVAVAVNWADKNGTRDFAEEKHFIDDMYILKADAGEAKTMPLSTTITVKTADTAEDQMAVNAAEGVVDAIDWKEFSTEQAKAEAEAKKTVLAEITMQLLLKGQNGVSAVVNTVSYQAPIAGTLGQKDGKNGSYRFTVTLKKNEVQTVTGEYEVVILPLPYVETEKKLVFDGGESNALVKGTSGKVYFEGLEDYAIDHVVYTTNNANVTVDEDGTLTLKPGYIPAEGETVKVTARITYYDPADVIFVDSFEGEKQFTDSSENVYAHSDKGSLFGRYAATPAGSATGTPAKNLDAVSDVIVTAWYYDAYGGADQTKFGFGINGDDHAALGVFYDETIAAYVDNMTKTHYGARVKGNTYKNYAWGTTDVERSRGWHKFQWIIDREDGLTEKIDGKVIATNSSVGKTETNMSLVKMEKNAAIKELNKLVMRQNWNNNDTNLTEIKDRYFIDGISVVKMDAQTVEDPIELTSTDIPVNGTAYVITPDKLVVDSTYPNDQTVCISPYVKNDTDIAVVRMDGNELKKELWTEGMSEVPDNAQNYEKEYRVTVRAEAWRGLADGEHILTFVTAAGEQLKVTVTAETSAHTATDYYLSQNGDDEADGHTPDTAWKTFEKLQSVTFGPGDHIYLDAKSTWSGVQFRPEGSGTEGNPIVLTKYNDGGDSSRRPILNGDGTTADLKAHSYLAFDAWRAFYPSGAIELFNVEQWEIRGIEITNYAREMTKGATGRNGIAVIFDYFEVQGLTKLPTDNVERERLFYKAGKLRHIVIDDCYVHDVVGYHPINGAQGRGGKMSGGINVYGPYDDLQINNNIVMYCDVEGIRNDVLAWMGDTRTQFPTYMEDISISNNYIVGVPGDGVVISSANKPLLENNYLTDAGYSYYATSNKKNVSGSVTWSASNLASCRDVDTRTGAVAKEMGNRQAPITMGATNFAGLWFIGTKDAVAQYNEAVNNVWVCNDGEAFDADMYCRGSVFQYNYTYRNNGGFCLFMGTMDAGTLVRYNVSVEDAQSIGISESQNGIFHYVGTPEAIHNNLFILGDKVATMFGGASNTVYFYNNMVIAPNGLKQNGAYNGFHINGSSDGTIQNPKLNGEMDNNLFYPAAVYESVVKGSGVTMNNNIVLDTEADLKSVFVDLDEFMKAQPVKALLGRSDFAGDIKVEQLEGDGEEFKGAGVAMSPAAGRSIKTPTGGFALSCFNGIRLAESSPAIGAGRVVDRNYSYKVQNDAAWPLTEDFFENNIAGQEKIDIGPFQYSSVKQTVTDALAQLKEAQNMLNQGFSTDDQEAVEEMFAILDTIKLSDLNTEMRIKAQKIVKEYTDIVEGIHTINTSVKNLSQITNVTKENAADVEKWLNAYNKLTEVQKMLATDAQKAVIVETRARYDIYMKTQESEKPDKPGGSENPDNPGGSENPDNPGGSENPDKPEESGQPDKPDKPEESRQPDRPDESEKQGVPGMLGNKDFSGTQELNRPDTGNTINNAMTSNVKKAITDGIAKTAEPDSAYKSANNKISSDEKENTEIDKETVSQYAGDAGDSSDKEDSQEKEPEKNGGANDNNSSDNKKQEDKKGNTVQPLVYLIILFAVAAMAGFIKGNYRSKRR